MKPFALLALLALCSASTVAAQPVRVGSTIYARAPSYVVRYAAFIPANNLEGPGIPYTGIKPPGATCLLFAEEKPAPLGCSVLAEPFDPAAPPPFLYRRDLFFEGDDRSFSAQPTAQARGTTSVIVFPEQASTARPGVDANGIQGAPTRNIGVSRFFTGDLLDDGSFTVGEVSGDPLGDCERLHFQGQASAEDLNVSAVRTGEHAVRVRFHGGAAIPEVLGAPEINWDVSALIDSGPGGDTEVVLSGAHDGFPAHEMWITNASNGDAAPLIQYFPGAPGATSCAGTSTYGFGQTLALFPGLDVEAPSSPVYVSK